MDLIGRILAYMDKPWKVAAIAGLGILAGAGWFIWDQKDKVAEHFLTGQHEASHLKSRETLAALLAQLVAFDDTALAMVWAIDIRSNALRFRTGEPRSHALDTSGP